MPPRFTDGLVWHYTDAAGLKGIIDRHTIWASSIHSLNDNRELTYGVDVLRAAARGRSSDLTEWVDRAARLLHVSVRHDSFIASASTCGSSASQFEHYGPYALGFDPGTQLTKQQAATGPASSAWDDPRFASGCRKVVYGVCDGLDHARLVLDALEQAHADKQLDPEDAPELLLRAAAYLKSDAWSDEREVRLYARPGASSSPLAVRVRGADLVRYIDTTTAPFKEGPGSGGRSGLPLQEVRLAPALATRPGAKLAVEELLRKHYKHVRVIAEASS